jgi:hypothetical protein
MHADFICLQYEVEEHTRIRSYEGAIKKVTLILAGTI